jgi:putative membrane protein
VNTLSGEIESVLERPSIVTEVVDVPLPPRLRRLLDVSPRRAFVAIGLLSLAVVAGLLLLVTVVGGGESSLWLPALTGVFNAGATVCLLIGWRAIRRGDRLRHRAAMLTALSFSALFLVTYITRHTLYGNAEVDLSGGMRAVYLTVLAVHVVLSVLGLPAVLATVWAAATGRTGLHKRLARPTLPVWLVVSVTGVVVTVFVVGWS